MRTVRIRTFILAGLLFMLSVPWIFFVTAHFLETKSLRLGEDRLQVPGIQVRLDETIRMIEAGADNWSDPGWQNELLVQLRDTGIVAVISDTSDQEIFRSEPGRGRTEVPTERISMMEDGQVLGKVALYLPDSKKPVSVTAIAAGLLLSFIVASIAMRRFIHKPLEKMSLAAREIAAGDWNVRLPSSRIKEITDVRDGFQVMVEGLQKSFKKQAELEEERRFVIAAVAHDLRTPLFALRGYLEGIEQGIAQSPDKLAKYLAVCKEKSAQLDRLVEDLFTFTKIEYLEAELSKSPVDFKLVLEKAIDSLSPQAGQKRITIVMNSSPDDMMVLGDPHLLERAMNNLLDNAVRHTPADGKIVVACGKVDHKVTFSVKDTGPGFASEDLGRVFEPLYRGEVSRNRSTGGTGLGLTISRKVIRRHGGELSAGNHPDQGAVLSGWIPSANAKSPDCQDTSTI